MGLLVVTVKVRRLMFCRQDKASIAAVVSGGDIDAGPVFKCQAVILMQDKCSSAHSVQPQESILVSWVNCILHLGWWPHGAWVWKAVGKVTSGEMVSFVSG